MTNYIHATCLKFSSFGSLDFSEESYLKWYVVLAMQAQELNWALYDYICAV